MTAPEVTSTRQDAGTGPAPNLLCRVDLWAAFAGEGEKHPHGSEFLDRDDRQWCARLRLPSARKQFLTARILLRVALADAVHGDVLPGAWHFARDRHGKPGLAPGFPKLHFSLAHEHQMAVVAVSPTNPVGIDVVRLTDSARKPPLWSAVAPSERVALFNLAPDNRAHDFARLWALKEAYAKMLGLGHALDFSSLEADLARRQLRQAERDCKAAFETHMLWFKSDCYFVALAVGTEGACRIDSRGHLLDLSGGSWFAQSEVSPHEAVWPKRWKWHWL